MDSGRMLQTDLECCLITPELFRHADVTYSSQRIRKIRGTGLDKIGENVLATSRIRKTRNALGPQ